MSERVYQVIIGVLVLVVLVGGWMMIAGKRGSTSTTMGPVSTSTAKEKADSKDAATSKKSAAQTANVATATGSEKISVLDQSAGKSVNVDSVTLPKLGWVAVQDEKEWVLGAARVEAGTHEDVTVKLLRATEKGETYKVVLYVDDGDKKFDLHKDTVITNSDGSTMSAAFIAK